MGNPITTPKPSNIPITRKTGESVKFYRDGQLLGTVTVTHVEKTGGNNPRVHLSAEGFAGITVLRGELTAQDVAAPSFRWIADRGGVRRSQYNGMYLSVAPLDAGWEWHLASAELDEMDKGRTDDTPNACNEAKLAAEAAARKASQETTNTKGR